MDTNMGNNSFKILAAIGSLQEEGVPPPYSVSQIQSELNAGRSRIDPSDRVIVNVGTESPIMKSVIRSSILKLGRQGLLKFSKDSTKDSFKVYPVDLGNKTESIDYLGSDPQSEVSRRDLQIKTRDNLRKLEKLGFKFEDKARVTPVEQYGRWEERLGHSFVVKGTDPEGKPVEFNRRETRHPAAGRTFLKTPHGNIQVSRLLSSKKSKPWLGSEGAKLQNLGLSWDESHKLLKELHPKKRLIKGSGSAIKALLKYKDLDWTPLDEEEIGLDILPIGERMKTISEIRKVLNP